MSTVALRERWTVTFKPPACRTLAGVQAQAVRFGGNAVVMSRASGLDDFHNWSSVAAETAAALPKIVHTGSGARGLVVAGSTAAVVRSRPILRAVAKESVPIPNDFPATEAEVRPIPAIVLRLGREKALWRLYPVPAGGSAIRHRGFVGRTQTARP